MAEDFILYRFRLESVNDFLEEHGLLYRLDVVASTNIIALIDLVMGRMRASPQGYQWNTQGNVTTHAHEALPLLPLSVVNRGVPRQSRSGNNQIFLRREPVNPASTVLTFIRNRRSYSPSMHCVENSRYVIRLCKCKHVVS
jgi:hypothetical protein